METVTDSLDIVIGFDVPGPNGEPGLLEQTVRVTRGPQPNQYRLEQALFAITIPHEIDEDTIRTLYWQCPVSYHDLVEAVEADEQVKIETGKDTLMFRSLVASAPGQRYEFRFDHDYLRMGKLSSPEAAALKERIEGLGAYCELRTGHAQDTLFIYVPPGISYDPTSDVEALPPFEADY